MSLRTSFGESSEIFGKWSEIYGKLLIDLYNKQNNTWLLVDMEYLISCSTLYLVGCGLS